MKRWLVVTVLIPRECGDAVSNFLIEQGALGIEEVDEDLKREKLKTYFSQDGKEKKALHALRRYLKSLQKVNPGISNISIETTSIPEEDWGENWKRYFKPVRVTKRVIVKPPWSPTQRNKNQIVINIHPGMAFGTGTHASTRLSILALETCLKKKGLSVLDVGTGSGILSIVAARSGAGEVWGLDVDGVAVENAEKNVRENKVSDTVRIRKGRIGDIQKKFDVVVANIDYKNLRRMRMPLIRHVKPRGFLILSGILERDAARLRSHFMETGFFQWGKVAQEEEWVCFTLKKK